MTHRKESTNSVSEKLQKVVKTSEPRVLDISQGTPYDSLLLFDVKQEKDKLLDILFCFLSIDNFYPGIPKELKCYQTHKM